MQCNALQILLHTPCTDTLYSNPHWGRLIDYAQDHDALLTMRDAYEPIMPQLVAQSSQNSKPLPLKTIIAPFPPSSSASASSSNSGLSFQDLIMMRSNSQPQKRNPEVVSAAEKLSNALGTNTKVNGEMNQIGHKRDRDPDSTQERNSDLHMSKKPTRSEEIEDGELE